jgi:uncharacterized protein YebE (UPF0316 family)
MATGTSTITVTGPHRHRRRRDLHYGIVELVACGRQLQESRNDLSVKTKKKKDAERVNEKKKLQDHVCLFLTKRLIDRQIRVHGLCV